jgi:hypothetical protein
MDIKFEELDALLSILEKHKVDEFQTRQIKIKLNQKPQAETKSKDITSIGPKKTPEQIAEETLFWSTRS